MQAAVLYGARDVRVEPVEMPEPKEGMALLRIKQAGICGSDLHYYADGYCGAFVPSRPFILGHELAAEVVAVNNSTLPIKVKVGSRVTVNPARACGFCSFCKGGVPNLCKGTIMLGSGSTTPPTNGAFAEYLTVRVDQLHELPDDMDDATGAMMEPLAVALQAVKQAGTVSGKRVLITGGGAIGLLTAVVAKAFGAIVVGVSDITPERRQIALEVGADVALDPSDGDILEYVNTISPDGFDIIFEASGARPALRQAFDMVKSGGTIVQIGTVGTADVPLPANQIMVKQITFVGSFRYADIFDEAIHLVSSGRIDLKPFITGVFPLSQVNEAFAAAFDKTSSLKVQITV